MMFGFSSDFIDCAFIMFTEFKQVIPAVRIICIAFTFFILNNFRLIPQIFNNMLPGNRGPQQLFHKCFNYSSLCRNELKYFCTIPLKSNSPNVFSEVKYYLQNPKSEY